MLCFAHYHCLNPPTRVTLHHHSSCGLDHYSPCIKAAKEIPDTPLQTSSRVSEGGIANRSLLVLAVRVVGAVALGLVVVAGLVDEDFVVERAAADVVDLGDDLRGGVAGAVAVG